MRPKTEVIPYSIFLQHMPSFLLVSWNRGYTMNQRRFLQTQIKSLSLQVDILYLFNLVLVLTVLSHGDQVSEIYRNLR